MNTGPEGAKEQGDYQSYVLRLWRVSDGEKPTWRAFLKSSRSGEQVGFDSLEKLFDHLRWKTGVEASVDAGRKKRSDKDVWPSMADNVGGKE